MTPSPPPLDRSGFAPRPPPLPARGFAVGVAVAAFFAALYEFYIKYTFEGPSPGETFQLKRWSDAVVLVFAAIGGLAGGWLSWRGFALELPVSLLRALSVVVAATVLSILIGCFVVGVVGSVAEFIDTLSTGWNKALHNAVGGFAGAAFVMPLFMMVLVGPTLAALVLVWTLVWRCRVNRLAALRNVR